MGRAGFRHFLTAGLLAIAQAAHAGASTLQAHVAEAKRLAAKDDYLGVRIMIRTIAALGVDEKSWLEIREMLHERPRFGFDLLRTWERIGPGRQRMSSVDQLLNDGARLMERRNFEDAFVNFQRAAKAIKVDGKHGGSQNSELYRMTLHLMAQALFGAGRFNESLAVYSWLPPTYSDYRRAVFERMWAAFRAGKINEAAGAIAAQYSSYFGGFLEPEAYLVQIYMYRKLCRQDDLERVLRNVKRFKDQLTSGRYGLREWLRSDFQTKPYLNILDQTSEPSSKLVLENERESEREKVTTYLAKRFNQNKRRLVLELDRVVAFSNMAFSVTSNELPVVEKLPPPEQLLKTGREMWPVSDAEDWLDEIGKHIFIGESQCAKKR